VVNALDGVCSVQVKPVAEIGSRMPRGSGKQVRGGRLWKIDEQGADGKLLRSALLVNDTTATTLIAANGEDPGFAAVADSITCGLA
jgi:hypothetical protein